MHVPSRAMWALVVLFAVTAPVFADEAQEVEKIERARAQTTVTKDLAAMERYLADDLIYVHTSGLKHNKKQLLEYMPNATPLEYMQEEDLRTRIYAPNVAVIEGSARMKRANAPEYRINLVAVYTKKPGENWKLSVWQSYRLQPRTGSSGSRQ